LHTHRIRTVGTVLLTLTAAVVLAGCGVAPRHTAAPPPRGHHKAHPVDQPVAIPLGTNTTVVATLHADTPGSPAPGAASTMTVPGTWYSYPSVLPVIDSAPGWVEVRLAQRPNGSTAWVPQSDVSLSVSPYRLVVNLTTEHLTVYDYGTAVLDFPAGIGSPDDPTPPGNYFVTMQVPAPDPGYGPFVLVTSDHSDSITDWAGTGDAIIAIHGPITSYDDSLIGATGAAISHGCIRLHDADLAQLADIPAGTPLDIVSGTAT
jgi:lipoprotein-anchoring transpeptidase ErfK/SrfK